MNLHDRVIKVLRASRVFGALDASVLGDLAGALVFQNVRGGALVLREGAISDSMLFVVSGGLRVSRRDEAGGVNLYNEIRPGQSVGEVGLILQQPRTADVTAVRDSCLAVLNRASYEALLGRHPVALNRVFVQTIYDFIRHTTQVVEQHDAQTFVVVPLHEGAGADEVAVSLVKAFASQGNVDELAAVMTNALDIHHVDGA